MEVEKKNKILLWVGAILCGICGFTIWLFRYDQKKIEVFDENHIIADTKNYQYYIDRCEYQEDSLLIEGWIYKIGEETYVYDTSVVLKNTTTNEYYKLPTMYIERQDVKGDVHSGFYCYALIDGIKDNINNYDLYIYDNNNNRDSLVYIGDLYDEAIQ